MPFVGLQSTHRGNRLCCASKKYSNKSIKSFWESDYIQSVRSKMLAGELVSDCQRCYEQEKNDQISLRQHYNNTFVETGEKAKPEYLDLDFSNLCNLQCIMCGPDRSSQWTKELGRKEITPIDTSAIDEILDMCSSIKHINLQGGEPSIMPQFDYLLQNLLKNGLSHQITIDCITNLTNLNNKFFTLLNSFKSVNLNVSVDSYGRHNDYIRYPSKFTNVEDNLKKAADMQIQINLQITLQTISMFNFYDFLSWINSMTKYYENKGKKLGLNMSFVDAPQLLNVKYAPNKLKKHFVSQIALFRKEKRFSFDTKFNLELVNLEKKLVEQNKFEKSVETIQFVENLDARRSIKITDYVPDFYDYFKKNQ